MTEQEQTAETILVLPLDGLVAIYNTKGSQIQTVEMETLQSIIREWRQMKSLITSLKEK